MEKVEEKKEREETKMQDLTPDIYPLILKRIPDIGDFFRCRAITKPWRVSSSLSDLGPQFPMLLKVHKEKSLTDLEFHSIALNKIYTIPAPVCSGKLLLGHAGGYMLVCKVLCHYTNKVSLANPLTNSEVPLPDLHHCNDCACDIKWICPSSMGRDGYVLITTSYCYHRKRLLVCKLGSNNWTDIGSAYRKRYFYLNGMLFIVELRSGITKVVNLDNNTELYNIPPPPSKISSRAIEILVESCGEILGVCRNSSNYKAENRFDIYRLELANGDPYWVKVKSIGDRMLFLDFHTKSGFCVDANNFNGLNYMTRSYTRHIFHSLRSCNVAAFRRNSIYFTNFLGSKDARLNKQGRLHVVNIYDIENDQTFYIKTRFSRNYHVSWFVPTLNGITSSPSTFNDVTSTRPAALKDVTSSSPATFNDGMTSSSSSAFSGTPRSNANPSTSNYNTTRSGPPSFSEIIDRLLLLELFCLLFYYMFTQLWN